MNEFAVLAQLTVVAMVPVPAGLARHDARRPRRRLQRVAGGRHAARRLGRLPDQLLTGSTAVGILLAAAVGAVFGFALGWATTALRLDQFVVGLALFFAATGLAGLMSAW